MREEMAMHFDKIFIGCLDSKSSLGKDIEAKHLKELVLLHLDLIEQQAEDILARDKIIKELKNENEIVSVNNLPIYFFISIHFHAFYILVILCVNL